MRKYYDTVQHRYNMPCYSMVFNISHINMSVSMDPKDSIIMRFTCTYKYFGNIVTRNIFAVFSKILCQKSRNALANGFIE